MKKKVLTIVMSVLLTIGTAMTSYAQWQQDDIGWRWVLVHDGSFKSHGWHRIDGKLYYFTPEGYCLMNTTTPDGYTVDENGARVVNGEVETLPAWNTPSYTLGINDEIWYLMDHTRAENIEKFGAETTESFRPYSGLPYDVSYVSDTASMEKRMTEKPYVVSLYSDRADITHVFADAPDMEYYNNFTAAKKLSDLGYEAKAKKIIIGGGYACQFKVDRFWVTIAYGNANSGTEIQIRQDFQDEESAEDYYGIWSRSSATETTD